MTESEAREFLSIEATEGKFTTQQLEALQALFKELLELAQYRAIGTVEDFATAKKG